MRCPLLFSSAVMLGWSRATRPRNAVTIPRESGAHRQFLTQDLTSMRDPVLHYPVPRHRSPSSRHPLSSAPVSAPPRRASAPDTADHEMPDPTLVSSSIQLATPLR